MPLIDYINAFYGGVQVAFAKDLGVTPAQVTQWLKKGFIVVNHTLYSPRRRLPKFEENQFDLT
ncbi:helix-turn-helix domain-containing protein [Salmonella enterica]|nr:helix-turn-helix domain-containing protein [Salmonella enterica]